MVNAPSCSRDRVALRSDYAIVGGLLGICAVAFAGATVMAQTWDGGGTNNNWTTANNWNPNAVPANNGTANLVFGGNVRTTPILDANFDINSLTFDNTAGAFAISGSSTLTVRGGGITNNDNGSQTIALFITLGASQSWTAASAPLNFQAGAINTAGFLLTIDGPAATTISATISGAGGLTWSGAGTLTLSGSASNTFAGTTTVNSGTLALGKTVADGAIRGDLVIGDGSGTDTVRLDADHQILATSGNFVTISAGGVFDLNSYSDAIQDLAANGGSVSAGTGTLTVLGTVTSSTSGSAALIGGNLSLSGGTGVLQVADDLLLSGAELQISASVTSGTVTKTGAGLMAFTGSAANQVTGTTTVNEGGLELAKSTTDTAIPGNLVIGDGIGGADADFVRLANNEQIAATPGTSVTINSSGLLDLAGNSETIVALGGSGRLELGGGNLTIGAGNADSTFTGTISGPGSVTKTGQGTLVLSGMVNDDAIIQVAAGTLHVANILSGAEGRALLAGGTTLIADATIQLDISGQDASAIEAMTDSVALGNATSFSGFNHQGTLNVGANTVTLNSAGYARLGVLTTLAGGTINAPNGVYLPGGGNVVGSGTVNARVTGDTGGVVEATGALALGDAASPAGFNYDGELRTKQFTVTLNSSAAAGLGNLTALGSGGSPGTLNAANGFVVDFDEAVTGYGTINSTNTLAKRATINGTVQGDSVGQPITLSGYIKGVFTYTNVNFTGTYSPGLSPTIASAGNVAFASTNTLIMELGGTTPGSGHDQIESSGLLTLGGTLQVSLINGFSPVVGNSFDLLNWASVASTFTALDLPPLAGGLVWNTSALYTNGVLSVAPAGVPGDYNYNGSVDAADYILWRKNVQPLPNNEVVTIGTTESGDYTEWRSRFGNPPGSGAGASAGGSASSAVPEPASGLLLLVAALGVAAFGGGRAAQ